MPVAVAVCMGMTMVVVMILMVAAMRVVVVVVAGGHRGLPLIASGATVPAGAAVTQFQRVQARSEWRNRCNPSAIDTLGT